MTFQGREIPRSDDAILNPKHSVLVIHEMLNDFVSKGGVADKAGLRYAMDPEVERIARLLEAARAKNVRVAYVRWTRYEDGSTDDDASCSLGSPVCSGRRVDAEGILKPMHRLLAGAREKNVRVAYTKWTNYADRSSFSSGVPGLAEHEFHHRATRPKKALPVASAHGPPG